MGQACGGIARGADGTPTPGPQGSDQRHPVAGEDGSPWRDMPERYGPWETAYGLFRQWQRDGVWAQVLTRLQAAAEAEQIITWDVSVDSTVCRAHQHAAGARKRGQIRNIRRVGWTPSPTTTPSAGHGAG